MDSVGDKKTLMLTTRLNLFELESSCWLFDGSKVLYKSAAAIIDFSGQVSLNDFGTDSEAFRVFL